VCFDFKQPDPESNYKPNEYIYKMIETMLPKSMVDEQGQKFKLLEL
jgi:hypothetical protein